MGGEDAAAGRDLDPVSRPVGPEAEERHLGSGEGGEAHRVAVVVRGPSSTLVPHVAGELLKEVHRLAEPAHPPPLDRVRDGAPLLFGGDGETRESLPRHQIVVGELAHDCGSDVLHALP